PPAGDRGRGRRAPGNDGAGARPRAIRRPELQRRRRRAPARADEAAAAEAREEARPGAAGRARAVAAEAAPMRGCAALLLAAALWAAGTTTARAAEVLAVEVSHNQGRYGVHFDVRLAAPLPRLARY